MSTLTIVAIALDRLANKFLVVISIVVVNDGVDDGVFRITMKLLAPQVL